MIQRYFLLILCFLGLFSCKRKNCTIEADCSILEESAYFFVSYYPDGNICKSGGFRKLKRNCIWHSYYQDGSSRWELQYSNNTFGDENKHILLLNDDRELPQLFFEHDSLIIGRSTRLQTIGLLPFETLHSSENFILQKLNDDPQYDYEIIPKKVGLAEFVYSRKTIERNFFDYKMIAKEFNITEDEAKKLNMEAHKETIYQLAALFIHDK